MIEEIFKIIKKERAYQDKKWGGAFRDSKKTIADWIVYLRMQLREAEKQHYFYEIRLGQKSIEEIIKIAALAIACLEYNLPIEQFENWRDNGKEMD